MTHRFFREQYKTHGTLWLGDQVMALENDVRDALEKEFGPMDPTIGVDLHTAVGWNECLSPHDIEVRTAKRRRHQAEDKRYAEERRMRSSVTSTEFLPPPTGHRYVYAMGTGLVAIPEVLPKGVTLPPVIRYLNVRIAGVGLIEVPAMKIKLQMREAP